MRRVRRPYPDRLILGCGSDVGFLEDGGRPGDVADPIRVACEFLDWGIGLILCTADLFSARKSLERKTKGAFMREERTCTPRS